MARRLPPPPDVPGTRAQGPDLHQLRGQVARLLSRESTRFPGAQPVSFAARHLLELQKQDYYVCEKSDGIRCLMYMTANTNNEEVIFLIDRKNDYYHVPALHFPLENEEAAFHVDTVVDGELVNDLQRDGSVQLKYLVFDCLVLDGGPLLHRILDKRLGHFREKVYKPFSKLFEKYPNEKQYLPFFMEFKNMERAYGIEMLFHNTLPNLAHGNDGLIFTCRNTPYKPGTDPHILKWKPANENSVDFRANLELPMLEPDSEDERDGITEPYSDYEAHPTFHLTVGCDGDSVKEWGQLYLTKDDWEKLKTLNRPLDEAIFECYQDELHRWRFMRVRDDKLEPNHISTVESVMESIHDRIGEQELIAIGKQVRDAWKAREREQQAQTRQGSMPGPPAQNHAPNGHGQPPTLNGVEMGPPSANSTLSDFVPTELASAPDEQGPDRV